MMPREALLKKLELPPVGKRIDMVLDTDTYNEVDDQFAMAYALLSPERLDVQAIYAAPFFNDRSTSAGDGMEKSYQEILRLLGKMNIAPEGLVYRGSERVLTDATPVDSPAARDLVRRAMARPEDDPLYVVAIGAITNVASAILMEPEIIRRIVVVWLGGQPLHWPTAGEFNLSGDLLASRLIFDCGVPLIQVPCMGVASHLLASVPELRACIGGRNPLCDALVELFSAYADDTFGWAKEIWDVSTIGILMNPAWSLSAVESSPILSLDTQTYARHAGRHPFRVITALDRNAMFRDMYRKLAKA
ncbi:MAG: nucleoside hydrolase [Clostridia bacterium]|nr:nucleoside hydrolase [Clostridia bacterium]